MAARPLIGITTYPRNEQGRYASPAAYTAAIRRAGGEVVLLPPGARDPLRWLSALDGLLLTGGGDIAPELYGGERSRKIYGVNRERDENELKLVRHVVDRKVPFLAICRGMQIVNVALGGTLHADVPDAFGKRVVHRLDPPREARHPVALEPGTALARLLRASTVTTASFHHQGVRRVAASLRIAAVAPDGLVEAAELPGHPFGIAVQWHPELTAERDPVQQRLFAGLVRAARRRTSPSSPVAGET